MKRRTGLSENALDTGVLRSNVAYETRENGLMQIRLCEGAKGCGRFFGYIYTSPSGKQFKLDAACGWVTVDGKDALCPECMAGQSDQGKV